MCHIGYDGAGNKLAINDICTFKLQNESYEHEGMIVYDEDTFSFCFEMNDSTFPIVMMDKADRTSIKKIINVWSTKNNNERYKWYQDLVNNPDF